MTLPPAHRALYTEYLSIYPSICLFVYLSICLSVYLFIHLSVSSTSFYPSLYPSIYLSIVCLSLSQDGELRNIYKDIWHVPTRDSQCRYKRTKPSWGNISTAARIYISFCHWAKARIKCISWQSRTWYFGGDFGCSLANSGHFSGLGATLWCRNPHLSPNNFTLGHYWK